MRWSYFRLSFVVSLTAAPRVMVPVSGSICIIYSVGLGFYFRLREFWFPRLMVLRPCAMVRLIGVLSTRVFRINFGFKKKKKKDDHSRAAT